MMRLALGRAGQGGLDRVLYPVIVVVTILSVLGPDGMAKSSSPLADAVHSGSRSSANQWFVSGCRRQLNTDHGAATEIDQLPRDPGRSRAREEAGADCGGLG
jgi:hypothetical protein